MIRIFVTAKIPESGVALLKQKGFEVDMYPYDDIISRETLLDSLKKYPYEALICVLTDRVDAEVFDAVQSLKICASYTVGFNNIDLAEAKKRGVVVTNTRVSQTPVAEHAVALMMTLTTRMVEADTFVREGKYVGWTPMAFMGHSISGMTVGLVGTGFIGSEVARMLYKGFGANVIYHDVVTNEHIEKEYNAVRCNSLEELLSRADIVSLHVPLLDSTHHLMNEKTLALMKSSAYLINTSRGPVVDEVALVSVLEKGVIAGAGLDVFEFEPKVTDGLKQLKNVVLTPHTASARLTTRSEMSVCAAENIIDFFEGRVPQNQILL